MYVNNYTLSFTLLQVVAIMMTTCMLCVMYSLYMYILWLGVRVSRRHLYDFSFGCLLLLYRLWFKMMRTWRWILCHLSLLRFVGILMIVVAFCPSSADCHAENHFVHVHTGFRVPITPVNPARCNSAGFSVYVERSVILSKRWRPATEYTHCYCCVVCGQ